MTPQRGFLFAFLALCLLADRASADDASAQSLFKKGRRLLEEGRVAEACPVLEESLRISAALVTRMNLAACYEGSERFASALTEFTEAARQAHVEGNPSLEAVALEHARAV